MAAHSYRTPGGDEPPTNARVRRGLNLLEPLLDAYVRQKLNDVPGARLPSKMDLQALLKAMRDHPVHFFPGEAEKSLRNYVHLLLGARGATAHDDVLGERETRQILETVALVAERIGAPRETVDAVDALNAQAQQADAPRAAPAGMRAPGSEPAAVVPDVFSDPRPPRVEPRRDGAGVIGNAEELVADDVAMQRVRCPACQVKVFEEWSAGWDAHAASSECSGLRDAGPVDRKAEFRRRYCYLFRPSTQRSAMRRWYNWFPHDHERVIREYAADERCGAVRRGSNAYGLTPEEYAGRLLEDGLRKGWIRKDRHDR